MDSTPHKPDFMRKTLINWVINEEVDTGVLQGQHSQLAANSTQAVNDTVGNPQHHTNTPVGMNLSIRNKSMEINHYARKKLVEMNH